MTSSLKLLPLWIPHGDELGAKEIFPPMLHFVWAFYHSDGNETRAVELGITGSRGNRPAGSTQSSETRWKGRPQGTAEATRPPDAADSHDHGDSRGEKRWETHKILYLDNQQMRLCSNHVWEKDTASPFRDQ